MVPEIEAIKKAKTLGESGPRYLRTDSLEIKVLIAPAIKKAGTKQKAHALWHTNLAKGPFL